MLKIEGIKLFPGEDTAMLKTRAAKALRLREGELVSCRLLRRSVDARDGVCFVCSVTAEVRDESAVLRRKPAHVSRWEPAVWRMPSPLPVPPGTPPVVVGAGPAGLFCALVLARAGARPILLERGRSVEQRQSDVERFWRTGELELNSNVQFGEGGAGAFSDGKLNTGTKDPRHRFILEQLVRCGAPEDILVDAKPHVGTDFLHIVLRNLRRELLSLGCGIRFGHRLTGLELAGDRLTGLRVLGPEGPYLLPCRQAVLALGHSARDTFEMLYASGLQMESKPLAVGVRIEHLQADMDAAQYKACAGHPCLPAASYKLSCHLPSGRAAYSFCVCPGGQVVAAASEEDRVVTNGMSEFARDRENINGGFLVSVTPRDFGSAHPLAGIAFQRRLEEAAFSLGGGGYRAPCQTVGDFLAGRPSTGPGKVLPSYRPGVAWTDLRQCLPAFAAEALAEALPILGKKVRGYDSPDAVLTAVETRSSSPVRIPRDSMGQANINGVYPCGEGAGWAGGILSAAADGMKCAEWLCDFLLSKEA